MAVGRGISFSPNIKRARRWRPEEQQFERKGLRLGRGRWL